MTLRNTGKVGFKYSITHPQKEEEEEEDAGGQMKALEEDMQQTDAQLQHDNERSGEGQEVRPGWPMVVPPEVSPLWEQRGFSEDHLLSMRVIFSHVINVCVSGSHRRRYGAVSACALPSRRP